ncbi:MAG: nucleotide exchange factor GrpE [Planctomycetota bacterium]
MALRKGKIKKNRAKDFQEPDVKAQSDDQNRKKEQTHAEPDSASAPTPEKTELQKMTEERDEYLDRLQRVTADFSNFQKRIRKEMEESKKYAAATFALDLLSVIDNLERALESASQKMDSDFLQGFTMIRQQMLGMLEKNGVTPIDAVNKPFDPNFHDALLEVKDDSLPDKTIVNELEKGYMIHDRLLRPTRVRVSRVPQKEGAKTTEEEVSSQPESMIPQETKNDEEISFENRNKKIDE